MDLGSTIFSVTGATPALPDVGQLSTCRGEPAFFISKPDLQVLAKPFENSLIGRFSNFRPGIDEIRTCFNKFDLNAECKLGVLDKHNVLIQPGCLEDFIRLFSRQKWTIGKYTMYISKWSLDFQLNEEASIVPVWFELPGLPLPFFDKHYVWKLASLIGRPLKIDTATLDLRRPSVARVLVEVDILKPRCQRIWIGENVHDGFWQPTKAETWPDYCVFCKRIGHNDSNCSKRDPSIRGVKAPTSKPQAPKPQPRGNGQPKRIYVPKAVVTKSPTPIREDSSLESPSHALNTALSTDKVEPSLAVVSSAPAQSIVMPMARVDPKKGSSVPTIAAVLKPSFKDQILKPSLETGFTTLSAQMDPSSTLRPIIQSSTRKQRLLDNMGMSSDSESNKKRLEKQHPVRFEDQEKGHEYENYYTEADDSEDDLVVLGDEPPLINQMLRDQNASTSRIQTRTSRTSSYRYDEYEYY